MRGRTLLASTICVMTVMVFISTGAFAATPTPNGFRSGPHFNLNIHGKQANFTCPLPEYYVQVTADNNGDGDLGTLVKVCDEGDGCEPTTIQAYGNSIFIPETAGADKVRVYVESGKKGPKSAPTTAELQVTDWCAGFGGGDNEVRFRLPSNEAGYDVYARILAKPTDNPSMTFSDPGLVYAQDDDGLLVWFGILTNGGFQTATETFTRYTGKSTAREITGLFQWTGDVCYTVDAADRTDTPFCQHYDAISSTYTYYPVPSGGCSDGDVSVTLFCSLIDNQWVFNIADFVEMFYDITNNGSKLVQVRFYPRQ
jgi:hypothetical protein